MTTSVFPLHRIQMEDERINVAKFITPKPPTLQKNKCKVLRRVEKEDKDEEQGGDASRSRRLDAPTSSEEKKPTYRFLDLDQRKSSVGMPEAAPANSPSTYVMFEMRNNAEIVCYPVSMYRFRPETDITGTSTYFAEDLPKTDVDDDPKEVLSEDLEKRFFAEQRQRQARFNKKHPRMARRIQTGKKDVDRSDKEDTAGLADVLNKLNKGKGGAASSTAAGVDDLVEVNTNPLDDRVGEDLVQNALSLQDELLAQQATGRMEETQEQVGDFSELFSDDEDDGVNRADIGTKAFEGYDSDSDEGGEDVDAQEQAETRDARESSRKMRGLLSGRAPKPKAPKESEDIDDEDEELKLQDIDISDGDDSDTDMTDGPKKSSSSKSIKKLTQGQIKSSNMSDKEKKAALLKKRKLAATSVAGLLHNTKRVKKSHDSNDNKKALYKMLGNEEFLCRLINSNQWTTQALVTRLDLEKADAKTRDKFRATFKKVAFINRQTNFLRLKPEYEKRFKKSTSSASSSSSSSKK